MPYKSEKIKLPPIYDRRRKLSEEDVQEIIWQHKQGIAIRQIARNFEGVCSRRRIQQLVNPDVAERCKARTREHWKEYVDREKLTEAAKNLRRYKHKLYKDGKI